MADSAVMDAQNTRKRKRATVACTTCHERKVRCNVAFQGAPCSNCAQDGTPCRVYGQQPAVRPGQLIRPREVPRDIKTTYPLTPSPGSANAVEVSRHAAEVSVVSRDGAPIAASPTSLASSDQHRRQRVPIQAQSPDVLGNARLERSPDLDQTSNLVPYYAGEAEGLEFLFDIASPNRPVKGGPYIIARNLHKREWSRPGASPQPRQLPPLSVCEQLTQCFFYYVYPFLPVVNAGEFLGKYADNPATVSPLLLWSVFFASTNYLGSEAVKAAGFKSRKSLKEYCYQNAKAIYDAQQEPDKTSIISATLLLAFWYVDLEDIDGSWSWIGIASNLCQGIGLHREPNYVRVPGCPFSSSQQALWRRLWWCCYYREAWLAVGLGRPMRIHLDDCDVRLPIAHDVLGDLRDMPAGSKGAYIPPDLEALSGLWIKLLQLSIKLEDVLLLHYRPRRPPLSLSQLEKDDGEIWQLLDSLPREAEYWSQTLTLHFCHMKCYFNSIIIALHRSYMVIQPDHLTPEEQNSLKAVATQRSKNAAASTTNLINRLISLDMIELSPTMLVTAMMTPMQIHLFEYAHSESIARQHAYHNLNLHLMVLSHLKRTFWSADMQHNLFTECLKAMDGPKSEKQAAVTETTQPEVTSTSRPSNSREDHSFDVDVGLDAGCLVGSSLEDFFWTFNPFYNMQSVFDQSASVDWDTTNSLNLDVT